MDTMTITPITQANTVAHDGTAATLREFHCYIPNAVVLRISTARMDGKPDNNPLAIAVAVSLRGCRLLDAIVLTGDDGKPGTVVIQCVRPQGQSATGKIWAGLLVNLKEALQAYSLESEPAPCSMKAAA